VELGSEEPVVGSAIEGITEGAKELGGKAIEGAKEIGEEAVERGKEGIYFWGWC